MANAYSSQYTGTQVDTAVGKVLDAVKNDTAKAQLAIVSQIPTNLENGSTAGSAQMKAQPDKLDTSGNFSFGTTSSPKNANAVSLDTTFYTTDSSGNILVPYGATSQSYASAFGGCSSAQGKRSMAVGTTTIAKGAYSFASGDNSVALGNDSHAEGIATTSYGAGSHSEGSNTVAQGAQGHAEGVSSKALGAVSHAEGQGTVANADYSHTEGFETQTTSEALHSHAEGVTTKASNQGAHAEGRETNAAGPYSHAEGYLTEASGPYSHAEGYQVKTTDKAPYAHAEGALTEAQSDYAHVEGYGNKALNAYPSSSGGSSSSSSSSGSSISISDTWKDEEHLGAMSHVEGAGNVCYGVASHVGGRSNTVYGHNSFAMGKDNIIGSSASVPDSAFALGRNNTASGNYSFAGGMQSTASGYASFSFGQNSKASASNAIAINGQATANRSVAIGDSYAYQANSMALGYNSQARGTYSLAMAGGNASAEHSVAIGPSANATAPYQITIGKYSAENSSAAFIVGNGADYASLSNAFEVLNDGRAKVQSAPTEDTDVVRLGDTATSSSYGLVKLGSDEVQTVAASSVSKTSSRTYTVQKNSDGQLVVNVPWSNTNTNMTYQRLEQTSSGSTEGVVLTSGISSLSCARQEVMMSATTPSQIIYDLVFTVAASSFQFRVQSTYLYEFLNRYNMASLNLLTNFTSIFSSSNNALGAQCYAILGNYSSTNGVSMLTVNGKSGATSANVSIRIIINAR